MFLNVQSVFKPTSDLIQKRVSTKADGTEGLGESTDARFSPDGRFVVFTSNAPDLVPGGTNGKYHVFLKELSTGAVTLLSAAGNTQANGPSHAPKFSQDGRYVVFESEANDLVTGDGNGARDVFRKDLTTGAITRISTTSNGTELNGSSSGGELSPDGNFLVFRSDAANLGVSSVVSPEIFLKNLTTGAVTRITVAADGTSASVSGINAHFSPDGRFLIFESSSSKLVDGDTNNATDIFRKELDTDKAIARISTTADGTEAIGGYSRLAQFSPDGRSIVFESAASNLVAGDDNGVADIFLKNLDTGAITRLSTAADGTQADNSSNEPRFSPDGRYVVFESDATNLVAGDNIGKRDVFLKDLVTGGITRLSTKVDGTDVNSDSYTAQFSPNGRFVTFESDATNLVANDGNNASDIFLVDLLYKA
ncbi:PD40 domain-containing protein, partial [Microvirga sp. HBU67558]|nr:PD40 domain-containing protein [Microvirga sp. HBU67558]